MIEQQGQSESAGAKEPPASTLAVIYGHLKRVPWLDIGAGLLQLAVFAFTVLVACVVWMLALVLGEAKRYKP